MYSFPCAPDNSPPFPCRSPLSKFVCVCVVLTALSVMTPQFYYIPQAALSAVIFLALQSLVNFGDLWEVYKHNKKDFVVMLTTLLLTFTLETSYGLAAGIGLSLLFFMGEVAFSYETRPYIHSAPNEEGNLGVEVVRLQGDLTFVQAARVKDFIVSLVLKESAAAGSAATRSENIRLQIAAAFDSVLMPRLLAGLNKTIPKAIVVDMVQVRPAPSTHPYDLSLRSSLPVSAFQRPSPPRPHPSSPPSPHPLPHPHRRRDASLAGAGVRRDGPGGLERGDDGRAAGRRADRPHQHDS